MRRRNPAARSAGGEAAGLVRKLAAGLSEDPRRCRYTEAELFWLLRTPLRRDLRRQVRGGLALARQMLALVSAGQSVEEQFLAAALKNYLAIYEPRGNRLAMSEAARTTLRSLPPGVEAFTAMHLNRLTGESYESTLGLTVARMIFQNRHPGAPFEYELDRRTFACEPGTVRRLDLYVGSHRAAFEIKAGRLRSTSHTRQQVEKDRFLLRTGVLASSTWILFHGGSAAMLDALDQAGCDFFDCGWREPG